MTQVLLTRTSRSIEGTFGKLQFPGGSMYVAELPWYGNQKEISCIPAGYYTCVPYQSTKFGKCFLLQKVPGRSGILFHHGNFAGDTRAGWASNSNGCILLGETITKLYAGERLQKAIGSSVVARKRFEAAIGWKSFSLKVVDSLSSKVLKLKRY